MVICKKQQVKKKMANRRPAFGNRTSTDSSTDPFSGYGSQAGYYTDWETGLSLLGFRYYDPGAGRFLNRDPIGYEGGVNLYNYCRNDSTIYADSTGLFSGSIGVDGVGGWGPIFPLLGGWGDIEVIGDTNGNVAIGVHLGVGIGGGIPGGSFGPQVGISPGNIQGGSDYGVGIQGWIEGLLGGLSGVVSYGVGGTGFSGGGRWGPTSGIGGLVGGYGGWIFPLPIHIPPIHFPPIHIPWPWHSGGGREEGNKDQEIMAEEVLLLQKPPSVRQRILHRMLYAVLDKHQENHRIGFA